MACFPPYNTRNKLEVHSPAIPHANRRMLTAMLDCRGRYPISFDPTLAAVSASSRKLYPRTDLSRWLAMRLRRPVRSIEDHQHFSAIDPRRNASSRSATAATPTARTYRDAKLRLKSDMGANCAPMATLVPSYIAAGFPGPYPGPQLPRPGARGAHQQVANRHIRSPGTLSPISHASGWWSCWPPSSTSIPRNFAAAI